MPERQDALTALDGILRQREGKRSFQTHSHVSSIGSLPMETPLEHETCSGARIVVSFYDAAVHKEVLREKTASLDNVNDLGRRTQPIMKSLRSARKIEGFVLI